MAFHYVCLIEKEFDDPYYEKFYLQNHRKECQQLFCPCKYENIENCSTVTEIDIKPTIVNIKYIHIR